MKTLPCWGLTDSKETSSDSSPGSRWSRGFAIGPSLTQLGLDALAQALLNRPGLTDRKHPSATAKLTADFSVSQKALRNPQRRWPQVYPSGDRCCRKTCFDSIFTSRPR